MMQFVCTHVFVLLIVAIYCEAALTVGDEGVCVRNTTTTKLNRYRIREKHQNLVVYCCSGWYYDVKTVGCKRTVDNAYTEAVICEDPCFNAKCTHNNTCECDTGHRRINQTHCASECPAQFINDPHTLNCTCEPGYSQDPNNDAKCLPICEKNCENGVCIAPNKCECIPGYEEVDSWRCKPKCSECENGECQSPDVCICNEGYNLNNRSKCTPICRDGCINGICSAPNECQCEDGYRNNSTVPHICYKPCNSVCNYGTCNVHGECICELGFELDGDTCKPITPEEVNEPTGLASPTTLAGLELSWVLSGVLIILLVVILVVIMQRIWQRRRNLELKASAEYNGQPSVIYTVPNTLIRRVSENDENDNMEDEDSQDCDATSTYENVEDEAEVRERLFKVGTHL